MTPMVTEAGTAEQTGRGKTYWGYHLILDCRAGDRGAVCDRETIITWVRRLVERIDMQAYGQPVCEHFAAHDPEAAGYSLVQLIETSSITAHFVDLSGDAYIDIFSCKRFEIDAARSLVEEYFRPTAIRMTYLTRQA